MHQDHKTGVIIADPEDCVSPGPNGFPETGARYINVETPAGGAVADDDTVEFPETPVPPPATPHRRRPVFAAVAGLVVAIVAVETLWPGTIVTGLVMAGFGAVAYLISRRRPQTAGHAPQEPPVDNAAGLPVGARTYRVRLFDNNYEVLTKRIMTVHVDLNSASAEPILMSKLAHLAEAARVAREQIDYPRLQVHDMTTGRKIVDVP